MNDFERPPIPDPSGMIPPPAPPSPYGLPPQNTFINASGVRDWQSAPKAVKSWAYQLTWLGIVVIPIYMFIRLATGKDKTVAIIECFLLVILLGVDIWLNRALKKGTPAAWIVQIVLSILGLLSFPIGTVIHGYLLSQWFKPEVKAWFRQS